MLGRTLFCLAQGVGRGDPLGVAAAPQSAGLALSRTGSSLSLSISREEQEPEPTLGVTPRTLPSRRHPVSLLAAPAARLACPPLRCAHRLRRGSHSHAPAFSAQPHKGPVARRRCGDAAAPLRLPLGQRRSRPLAAPCGAVRAGLARILRPRGFAVEPRLPSGRYLRSSSGGAQRCLLSGTALVLPERRGRTCLG